MSDFIGFPPRGLAFLRGLSEDNTKDYFSAHRGDYDQGVSEPAQALVKALGRELQLRLSGNIRAEPKVGKSLFRIHRDLRFSKDKTPYHPWADFVFWEGGEDARTCPGFFLRIAADHVALGTGVFQFPPEALERFRRAIADEGQGTLLTTILDTLQTQHPSVELSPPSRARVPAPFPGDHPRSALLRLERFHASTQEGVPEEVYGRDFVSWCVDRYHKFLPLHRWLVHNLGTEG